LRLSRRPSRGRIPLPRTAEASTGAADCRIRRPARGGAHGRFAGRVAAKHNLLPRLPRAASDAGVGPPVAAGISIEAPLLRLRDSNAVAEDAAPRGRVHSGGAAESVRLRTASHRASTEEGRVSSGNKAPSAVRHQAVSAYPPPLTKPTKSCHVTRSRSSQTSPANLRTCRGLAFRTPSLPIQYVPAGSLHKCWECMIFGNSDRVATGS
jgi:hypothetical protein